MELQQAEAVDKIASKIKANSREKRVETAKEINELANILIDMWKEKRECNYNSQR